LNGSPRTEKDGVENFIVAYFSAKVALFSRRFRSVEVAIIPRVFRGAKGDNPAKLPLPLVAKRNKIAAKA
jgi:hypothetical protein